MQKGRFGVIGIFSLALWIAVKFFLPDRVLNIAFVALVSVMLPGLGVGSLRNRSAKQMGHQPIE